MLSSNYSQFLRKRSNTGPVHCNTDSMSFRRKLQNEGKFCLPIIAFFSPPLSSLLFYFYLFYLFINLHPPLPQLIRYYLDSLSLSQTNNSQFT